MIKLIATDLDNTLLAKDGSLPDSTADLLVQCVEKGVSIAISTGRSFASAKGVADQFLARIPAEDKDGDGFTDSSLAICYNGAQIRDLTTGETVFSTYIKEDLFRGVIDFCHEQGMYIQLYDRDEIVVEKLDLSRHPDPDLAFASYREVGDLTDHPFFESPKILLADDPALIPEKQALLEKTFEGRIFCAQSASHLIEVMPAGINKGVALDALRSRLMVSREETMALGDNTNDSHLLMASGFAVAVSNAVPALKEIADYVCENERSAGVEEALRKFVLI